MMKLAFMYAIFALIATAANIGTQDLFVRTYHSQYNIVIGMLAGTGIGLAVKYILDKRYIFRFRARSTAHDGKTFVLYTIMGLITTVVFWGFELSFEHMFQAKEMRYVGGVIGLAIGYLCKYHLDKRYVFQVQTQ